MRTFVIINNHKNNSFCENIIEKIPTGSNIIVFTSDEYTNETIPEKSSECFKKYNVELQFYPKDIRYHGAKLKNFVSLKLFEMKLGGFVHVLEDAVQIYNNPENFLVEIERMMKILDLKSWFNTSCDICNYVYSKYNPRFFIAVDEEQARAKYDKIVAWCSNANTVWVCYNFDIISFEDIRFEEKFSFPMYYIIEFLARRRNTKKSGQLDYMNFYPSIPEELDVFRNINIEEEFRFSNENIQAEDKIFKEMNIDNHPDISLDNLMEDMRNAILKTVESGNN